MKITRNYLRGTSCVTFGLGIEDDANFKEWLREASKPKANLYDTAEKVLKRRGGKVEVSNSPCDCDDD